MHDIVIIGGGPAGLSAAITARQRGKSAAIISNDYKKSGLFKAPEIGNYPGIPGVSGSELLDRLIEHASGSGAEAISGRVNNVLSTGNTFQIGYDSDIALSKSIIIAIGVVQSSLFSGEERLLGSGVSHCATCDGMLFRGKRVCVVPLMQEAGDEVAYLSSIGCDVVLLKTRDIIINGDRVVQSVTADGEDILCEGVFILRHAIAPQLLLPGLELENSHIAADRSGSTNIPGAFAAGDCTGAPYQIAKAVGEGQIAALAACAYIEQ